MRDQVAFTVSVILLALLFVFVALLAGWLFTMGPPDFDKVRPPGAAPAVHGSATGTLGLATAADGSDVLGEHTFTAEAPTPDATTKPVLPDHGIFMGGGETGEIPMLCPQTGPQIRAQEYYPSPVLHEAVASANMVTFHLGEGDTEAESGQKEDQP